MNKVTSIIKDFCTNNAGKKSIDFSFLKNPKRLYDQFGENKSFNTFKGEVFAILLEELFRGNGYLAENIGKSRDGGCDVLVKYPNNEIRFIVQAKNWAKSIDEDEVVKEHNKFIRNYRNKFDLNDTNYCFASWKFIRGIKNKFKKINFKLWDEDEITHNLFKNYQPKHPKHPSIILEPYQEIPFENILKYFKKNKRSYVEHCTGTGKTYIISKLCQNLLKTKKNRILILSPSVLINERIYDLLETITYRKNISTRFNKNKPINLLTYQYLLTNISKHKKEFAYSHVLMDEVHRAGANKWFSEGIDILLKNNPKVVGLSATMDRFSGGQDVKSILGNNCSGKLTLFDAISFGILPNANYVYSVLSLEKKIKELRSEIRKKYEKDLKIQKLLIKKLGERPIKSYDIHKIIFRHFNNKPYRKIIIFCESIDHLYEVQPIIRKTFRRIRPKHKIFEVHSSNQLSENKKELNSFSNHTPNKNECLLMFAVDMLNEGINVNGIDAVMLFRKTESPRIYFQQIGRAIRRHGVKNPLIFDCVLNYQNVKVNFGKELIRAFDKRKNSLKKLGLNTASIPRDIGVFDETVGISEIIKEVEIKCEPWNVMFAALKEYRKIHGDCNVPQDWPENKQLGTWVSNQRANYQKGNLSKDHIKRLEDIGFIWNTHESQWEEMFAALKEYRKIHGNCNVPQDWPENKLLGSWVSNQRANYQKGNLSKDHIKRLEDIGFVWDSHESQWEDMFAALKEYRKIHGGCNIPRNWPENKLLGSWVSNQRTNYQKGNLCKDHIKRLEDIGFIWNRHTSQWEEMFAALKEYKSEEGHCNVPTRWSENKLLGSWVSNQRTNYQKGNLSKDHIKRLEDISFIWKRHTSQWEEMFAALKEYKSEEGHCNVPTRWSENKLLATWVDRQRSTYKGGNLSKDRIKRLEDIGFVWDLLESQWEEMFAALKEYKSKEGHCNVPSNWGKNPKLGCWVIKQRTNYRNGNLSKDRIKRLEDESFIWNISKK